MKYNLSEISKELYTFKEASLKIGKKQNYFTQMYKLHPDWFHPDTIMTIGRDTIISLDGIDYYLENANFRKPKKDLSTD